MYIIQLEVYKLYVLRVTGTEFKTKNYCYRKGGGIVSDFFFFLFKIFLFRLAKMEEENDPELTFSPKRTKITTICRTTIDDKEQKLPQKIFCN